MLKAQTRPDSPEDGLVGHARGLARVRQQGAVREPAKHKVVEAVPDKEHNLSPPKRGIVDPKHRHKHLDVVDEEDVVQERDEQVHRSIAQHPHRRHSGCEYHSVSRFLDLFVEVHKYKYI